MSKPLKNLLKALILILVIIVLAIFRPWTYISLLPLIGPKAALTVNATAGRAEVYLNDEKVGDTPYSAEDLQPGDYKLEIRRVSEQEGFYEPYTKQIHLESDTRTFVETEIGPSIQFSSVKLMYYQKNNSEKASIFISSTPTDSTVWIDDLKYGTTPLSNESINEGTHSIKIEKDGYIESQSQIQARNGYTLIVEFNLLAKPIELEIAQ